MPNPVSKAAIVTGGALGIGGATARRLARDGAAVLVADVDADAANANAARIADAGGNAIALKTDVTRSADIDAMVDAAVSEFGRLDILVNNAVSSAVWGADNLLDDISESDFDAGMGILVKAHFLAAKRAAPHMRAAGGRKHRQHIVRAWAVRSAARAYLRNRQSRRHRADAPACDRVGI